MNWIDQIELIVSHQERRRDSIVSRTQVIGNVVKHHHHHINVPPPPKKKQHNKAATHSFSSARLA